MKLYYHPGSNPCRRVVAVALHLGLPLDLQQIDFMDDNDPVSKKMKSLDPAERIPVLDDDGFILSESTAIMHYLSSKKVGSTLVPKDPKEFAEVLRWQSFGLAHLEQATGTFVFENLFKKVFEMGEPDKAAVAEALEEYLDHAGVLDQYLKGRTYFVGKSLSLADFSVGAAFMYWEQSGLPLTQFKNLHAWYKNLETLPAWQKSTPKF